MKCGYPLFSAAVAVSVLAFAGGCDPDNERIAKLERQVAELKRQNEQLSEEATATTGSKKDGTPRRTSPSIHDQLLMDHINKTKVQIAKTQIKMFDDALEQYRLDLGEYPESLEDLVKNKDNDNSEKWQGPYLKPASIPKDPWGHEYEYIKKIDENDREYEIICPGPDGNMGTKDDITNHDGE